jgi:hypothetical protein
VKLAVATALVYLAVGLLYADRFGPAELRGIFAKRNAAYLNSFAGWNTDSEMDAAGFNRAATSILNTGLPRSRQGTVIWRTAVYAYFVAFCYAIGGLNLWPLAIAQAALAGLTGWLLAKVAGKDRWIAGLLFLVNLRFAMYVGYIVPLILTLCFTAAALWAANEKRSGWFAGSLALGVFTSATFFVIAAAAGFWWWWRRRTLAVPATIAAVIALKMLLTWTNVAGNAAEANRAADRGGIVWLSNNPSYEKLLWWSGWEWRPAEPGGLHEAVSWVAENPGQYAKLCFIRLRTEFCAFTAQMSPRNQAISTMVWLLIFPAGLIGLWRRRREPLGQLVIAMALAHLAFGTFVTEEPYLRYRMPVDLALTVFAAGVYGAWWRRRSSSNTAAIRAP